MSKPSLTADDILKILESENVSELDLSDDDRDDNYEHDDFKIIE